MTISGDTHKKTIIHDTTGAAGGDSKPHPPANEKVIFAMIADYLK